MAISRMQQPRQQYGLGSLVKKAVRGVKKIAKSPLGKAAIIGGLGMIPFGGVSTWGRLGGMLKGMGAAGSLGARVPDFVKGTAGQGGFFKSGLGRFLNPWSSGQFSGKHAFGLASAAALAAPFLMKGEEPEDVVEESWTQVPSSIADIRNQARNYYTNPDASTLAFMPGKQFVNQNFYAADGGRVGLMYGGNPNEERAHSLAGTHVGENLARGDGNNNTVVVNDTVTETIPESVIEKGFNWKNILPGGQPFYGPITQTIEEEGDTLIDKTFSEPVAENINKVKEGSTGVFASNPDHDPNDPSTWTFAQGGRVGLLNGGGAGQEQIEQMLMAEYVKYKNQGGTLSFEQFVQAVMQQQQEQQGGGMEQPQEVAMAANGGLMGEDADEYNYNPQAAMKMYRRPRKQEGGIMETEVAEEMIDLGGQEKDYRETGGFVDLGGKERADDVPARLSKNEFVFTADAVRNAGGGDIDKGSEVMQNLMDNLEAGGEVSEDSQGLEGAQAMYDQQQMLQSRIA